MEIWFVLITSVCIAFLLNALLSLKSKSTLKLPPGPINVPILTTILWLRKSGTEIETTIRNLSSKFGPIITVPVGLRPAIFVSSRELAHEALVHKGAIFADRPQPVPTAKILSSNQHNISSAGYGPKWRTFRRNLTSEMLHPSRAKDFRHARKWVLDILLDRLRASAMSEGQGVKVIEHSRFAMFCLLVTMCFGEKLDESKIREIEEIQFTLLTSFRRFGVLDRWPSMTRILLRGRWNELYDMKKKQHDLLVPLIRRRKQLKDQGGIINDGEGSELAVSYVDTLLTMELSDDNNTKRKLNEEEIVSACSEFLNAGTDTTSTAVEWIMANLVKYPGIQAKLLQELKDVVGEKAEEIKESDLSKMYYLKAVVLEGLRRHPPGHFVLQHAVTQDVELGGYLIPKDATINFTVAEMGRDPEVWEDPMEFRPERFMTGQEEFDITGSHEIKMMPFGVGRRICPGYGLAMHHLEYYVANLVWNFEWRAADGYEVDLSEKQEFTVVMKNPLHAIVSPRQNN
ncbi:cytochrome P450 89A2-like [Silene latifolia]|uniref:cytochrome P450 89A2-like n=1 Tax=Silene latifolia TaxID=37657 RepID=UPI003D78A0E9